VVSTSSMPSRNVRSNSSERTKSRTISARWGETSAVAVFIGRLSLGTGSHRGCKLHAVTRSGLEGKQRVGRVPARALALQRLSRAVDLGLQPRNSLGQLLDAVDVQVFSAQVLERGAAGRAGKTLIKHRTTSLGSGVYEPLSQRRSERECKT